MNKRAGTGIESGQWNTDNPTPHTSWRTDPPDRGSWGISHRPGGVGSGAGRERGDRGTEGPLPPPRALAESRWGGEGGGRGVRPCGESPRGQTTEAVIMGDGVARGGRGAGVCLNGKVTPPSPWSPGESIETAGGFSGIEKKGGSGVSHTSGRPPTSENHARKGARARAACIHGAGALVGRVADSLRTGGSSPRMRGVGPKDGDRARRSGGFDIVSSERPTASFQDREYSDVL